ncbi:MAG: chromate transporter [Lachnospiraceae bacterium]|nr:chromate transporter [Lachnospiraceae bacterium]
MKENKKPRTAIELFLYFFRIGFFTFGGGMSIVAQLQTDWVEKKKRMTSEELLDIVGVGRSIPGTMITNVAYLFGHQLAGPLGGFLSLLGMTLPSVIVLALVTWLYEYFEQAVWFTRMMTGIRAAIVPIVLTAAFRIGRGITWNIPVYFFFALAFLLSALDLSRPLIILLCGAASFLYYTRRGGDAI